MYVIRVRNVNQALPEGIYQLASRGIPVPSRGGEAIMVPEPVTTVYRRPTERVLFYPERDANPFFHFFESLWMLAGRNDLAFVKQFVKNFDRFSDNGVTLHGAYGKRWRDWWRRDQLVDIIAYLKKNPFGRRGVLTMWDPEEDFFEEEESHADVPCNTQAYFWNLAGRLQMTVTCRSNDIIWGAYGANAVHFSMLQEYLAGMLGCEVGTYYQVSNNYHAYLEPYRKIESLKDINGVYSGGPILCPYTRDIVKPSPIMQYPDAWDDDLADFLERPLTSIFKNSFFTNVAIPLWLAHQAYRNNEHTVALHMVKKCAASDWQLAAQEWLLRRQSATVKRLEDGRPR